MEKENVSITKAAMHYGALLGIFWLFKYLFLIGSGFSDHVFIYIYYLLNVGTFLLIYISFMKYRFSDSENPKSKIECILFTVMACFFASFFEGLIMYAHYQFIHPQFFVEKVAAPVIRMMNALPYPDDVKTMFVSDFAYNKGLYIFSQALSNMIIGLVLALFICLLGGNKKPEQL